MTPADIIEIGPTRGPARTPTRRKRAALPKTGAPSRSSPGKRMRPKTTRSQPKSVWVRLRRKLAEGAKWAVHDARVGMVVFLAFYFGTTWVMLALIGVDAVAGTSLFKLALDWFATIKFTALGAGLAWGLVVLAPAALVTRLLRSWVSARVDPWAGGLFTKQLVRPIVGALAFRRL
jgi:hypothetical protein